MKKSLFLLAALPLLAGCAHDRMQDRSDMMNREPYVNDTISDRSLDRHAVGQPGENRAVRGAETQSDDRIYQRDLQEGNLTSPPPGASEGDFPSATSDQFDNFPDNYTSDGVNRWHRNRWMRSTSTSW